MEILQAFILAIVQGLTEFLPVSSSAHLILLPKLFGWSDQGLAFDVAVHVGTLLAVIAFLRKELSKMVPAWCVGWRQRSWDADGRLAWYVILATIPVGLVGLIAGDWIEANLRSALVIAMATFFFALLLAWADRHGQSNQASLNRISWRDAFLVGCAQACALTPGASRSGVTMTALLSLGYSRVDAARFSFLLAVPAIALPGILKTIELISLSTPVNWIPLLVGVIVSALTALACMAVFIRFVQTIGMLPFVIYRVLLAAVIVIVVM